MKSVYDMGLEELEKRKKLYIIFEIVCIIVGEFYVVLGFVSHYMWSNTFLSLAFLITGLFILMITCIPSHVKLLIYLKKRGV